MVEAVLLPFKGQIVYDGLLSGYRVHFGGGIRSDINHTYIIAKHKKRVISTLEPEQSPSVEVKPGKNILPQLKELSATMSKLKSASALQNSALALARASLEISIADAEGALSPDDIDAFVRKIHKASTRLLNLFQLMEEE
jgi:superfamily II DNA/RNA helicase